MAKLLRLIISLLALLMKLGLLFTVLLCAVIGFDMGGGNNLFLALIMAIIGFFIFSALFSTALYLLTWVANLFLRDYKLVLDNHSAQVHLFTIDEYDHHRWAERFRMF